MRINYTDKILTKQVNTPLAKDLFTTDVTGLNVVIRPSSNHTKNAIHFKFKKVYQGKLYNVTIGTYPRMSITEARQKYLEMLMEFDRGEFNLNKEEKKKRVLFKEVWEEYYHEKAPNLRENTRKKYLYGYKILSCLDGYAIEDITPEVVRNALQIYRDEGKHTTVHFCITLMKSVMDYAVQYKGLQYNIITGMGKFLTKPKITHYRAFKDATLDTDMQGLFRDIAEEDFSLQCLIYMYFFTLLRSQELRTLRIDHCYPDFIEVKTKTLDEFRVPLCPEAKKIIELMKAKHKGYFNPFVFEGMAENGIVSCNTVNKCLKKHGYGDKLKVHGIRTCGRQWMQTLSNAKESIIELCLSHVSGNAVQQAYNRGEYFEERKRVMFAWCEFVVTCAGNNLQRLLSQGTDEPIL